MDVWEKNPFPLLSFEETLLTNTLADDVLFIVGRGLNVERLFLSYLYFCNSSAEIVFVINTKPKDNDYFLQQLRQFDANRPLKMLTFNVSIKERCLIYKTGGIQFITSRLLMVDLLSDRVPINKVAGIFIYHAHEALKGFQESFILRLFRENSKSGFIKAFTDNPNEIAFQGIGQLQSLVDKLYVKRVVLLPRFDSEVKNCFDRNKSSFTQMSLHLPQSEKKLRTYLSNIIATCVKELKQCSLDVGNIDVDKLNRNAIFLQNEETNFEDDLQKRASLLTQRQERLLIDLKVLRTLLFKVENLDPTNAWNYVYKVRSDKNVLENNSGWIFTPTAAAIFSTIQSLCFQNNLTDGTTICAPHKWDIFISVLEEISQKLCLNDSESTVLVIGSSEQTCQQLMDLTRHGKLFYCWSLAHSVLEKKHKGNKKKGTEIPPEQVPLWNVNNILYYNSQLFMEENQVNKNHIEQLQKKVCREAKKRAKITDLKAIDPKQPKLVNFGIVRYSEKKVENKSKKLQSNFGNYTKFTAMNFCRCCF